MYRPEGEARIRTAAPLFVGIFFAYTKSFETAVLKNLAGNLLVVAIQPTGEVGLSIRMIRHHVISSNRIVKSFIWTMMVEA